LKIIILASRFPYPLERGDKLRLYQQIKELSKHHELVLFAVNDMALSPVWINEISKYCSEIYTHKISIFDKIFGLFISLIKGWPFQCGLVYSISFKDKLLKYCIHNNDAIIYCQLIRMVPYTEGIKNKRVLDYMDAFGVSMDKRASISRFPFSTLYSIESTRVKHFEKLVAKRFSNVSAITHLDASNLGINNNVLVIPNTIDLDYFRNDNDIIPKYDIGFIGNLGYLPNIQAVKFLILNILPAYQSKYSKDLKVLIAGARPNNEVKKLAKGNITLMSDIEDIRNAYKSIKIQVAPINSGTGQQNKVLESMAMNVPVITSFEVNDTIGAKNKIEIICCNNIEEYVDSIHFLLKNDIAYTNIQRASYNFVLENFKVNRVGEMF
jgi:glycosyltransferase involved in cell wall biosynthesis